MNVYTNIHVDIYLWIYMCAYVCEFSISYNLTHNSKALGLADTIGCWHFLVSQISFLKHLLKQPLCMYKTRFIPNHLGK
jgi:hypothetical protein